MTTISRPYAYYIFIVCIILNSVYPQCMSVDPDNSDVTTDMMSYLYYGSDEVNQVDVEGYIYMNYTHHVNQIPGYLLYQNIYTVYKLGDIGLMGNVDMSEIFKTVYNNGYRGLILSSSESKPTGEIMYFYYTDDTFYDIDRFEVREGYLTQIMDEFPDGGYFNIKKTEECNPYFNYWMDFFLGVLFHLIWILTILFSIFVLVSTSYIALTKWKHLPLIFKICITLYAVSLVLQVITGISFVTAKYYRQGSLVPLFQISDILGGVVAYSLSLAALILYISNFHLSVSIRIVDISETSRIVAIVASLVMLVLTVIGVLVLVLAESSTMYYICFLYFLVMLISAIVYYVRINLIFLSVFSGVSSGNKKLRRKVDRHFRNMIIQNIMLILVVASIITTFYIFSTVQTGLAPCLIRVFFNVTILMQLSYFNNINNKSTGSSSKVDTKAGSKKDTSGNETVIEMDAALGSEASREESSDVTAVS